MAGLVLGLAGASACASGPDRPLEFGIFPYLNARALLTVYAPLQDYLERELKRPVSLSTAPGFEEFHQRTVRGDYDLVLTPPHFARLAQSEAGYVPIDIFTRVLHPVFVVKRDDPITTVTGLRGRRIVVPDRLALVSIMAIRYLREQGMRPGQDYALDVSTSHASAVYSVTQGEYDAAVTEAAAFGQIAPEVRANLRVLAVFGSMPHIMFAAHPRLSAPTIARLKTLLMEFANASPEGQRFIQASGFEGIRPVTPADLRTVDPYAHELKRLLGVKP
jgi:phosphonate transport system substrate-binding protein